MHENKIKILTLPLLSIMDTNGKESFSGNKNKIKSFAWFGSYILLEIFIARIVSLGFIMSAIYLSWECNKKEGKYFQIISAFFAGVFSFWYLLFYLVYRVMMGNKCGKKKCT